MAKRLRGDTQIWLFGKCPPVVNEEKQIEFTSARPPPVADVFVNYCGQHQYLKQKQSDNPAEKMLQKELLLSCYYGGKTVVDFH